MDVSSWYVEMPRQQIRVRMGSVRNNHGVIPHYFASRICVVCEETVITDPRAQAVCSTCLMDPQASVYTINRRLTAWDATQAKLERICLSCAHKTLNCDSLDCPVFYARAAAVSEASQIPHLQSILDQF